MPDLPKGLPAEVAARLDVRSICVRSRGAIVEARRTEPRKIDLRRIDETSADMAGYATVYDYEYDVAGGPDHGGFTEIIALGAATRSVKHIVAARPDRDDVRLLVNHDGAPLARTKSGTMTLTSDDTGLLVDAGLDLRSVSARDAALAMERGDLDEMSFAFQVIRQEWNADYTERLIREVKLFDVSLVTYPANPAASAYLRPTRDAHAAASAASRGMSLSLAMAQADALKLSPR